MFDMQEELFSKIEYTVNFIYPSDLYDEDDNPDMYEDEHWDELANYLHADDVAWGASKVVFWFSHIKDYVIKVPLMGYYEDDVEDHIKFRNAKFDSNSKYADWDYCGAEAEIYNLITEKYPELAKFFAATYFIGINRHNVPIYAAKRVTKKYDWDIENESKISSTSYTKARKIVETFGRCGGLDENIISLFYEQYDETEVDAFLDFIMTYHIDDLHSGNIGVNEDGKIVIMDYSGFDS